MGLEMADAKTESTNGFKAQRKSEDQREMRPIALEDFLFISPYNLEARYIWERLPRGLKWPQ